jgi:ectoine hydroxylase-related dioxygenase (phytanoyl-CoA dioxygenase family)
MISLNITPDEKAQGHLTAEHLAAATQALKNDGLVVLENIVDPAHLEALKARMLEDTREILKRPDLPTQFTAGNIQQDPPPMREYLFKDILVNDLIISITKSILGPGLTCDFYSGNTNLPGSAGQPVHPDQGQLWPDMQTAHPAVRLVVNIPVVDMDEKNGSTELWQGTHLDTTMYDQMGTIRLPPEALEARRRVSPPFQPSVKAGSVLIRDIRLWHRGTPNDADQPRPMIAMIHNVSWWPTETMVFPKGMEEFFVHPDLRFAAQFVEPPIDYLHNHSAYDVRK